MKHPIDYSTIIIIILVALVRISYTSLQCWGKFEEAFEAEGEKAHELMALAVSDVTNGHIASKLFGHVGRNIIVVEATVGVIIREADKLLSNDAVENLIGLALAIASLNPAIAIPIDIIKVIVVVLREGKKGIRKLKEEQQRQLKKSLFDLAIASIKTLPEKLKERFAQDEKKINKKIIKIVRISKSESNGEIAKELSESGPIWVESEVAKVIREADKVYSNPVTADVLQLGEDVAGLQNSNQVAVNLVVGATLAIDQIKEATSNGKPPLPKDLDRLKRKIKGIGEGNAKVYTTKRSQHFWEKQKVQLETEKEKICKLVYIAKSDRSELGRILLDKMKVEVITVESVFKDLIIKIEEFFKNPINENLLELALHIAEINPYVQISVSSFKLVVAAIKEIKKIREEWEGGKRPSLFGKVQSFREEVIKAATKALQDKGETPERNVGPSFPRSFSSPLRGGGIQGPRYTAFAPSSSTPAKSSSPHSKQSRPQANFQAKRDPQSQTSEQRRPNSMNLGNQDRPKSVEHSRKTPAQQPNAGSTTMQSYGVSPVRRSNAAPMQTANARHDSASGGQAHPQDRAHSQNRTQGISAQGRLDNQARNLSTTQQNALAASQNNPPRTQYGGATKFYDGAPKPRFL